MNKKADKTLTQFLVVLVITVAAGLLLLILISKLSDTAIGISDYSVCKESNLANAKLKLKITNQVILDRQGNKCTTEYVKAPKGKEIPFITNKMASCWDMYLEGKEELFETKDNTYCAFCSVIDFEANSQPISGLTNYLATKEAPQKGMTYYQYLTGTKVTKDFQYKVENSDLAKLHVIDTSVPQSVIFIMGKNANPGSWTGESAILNSVVGGTLGATIGGLVAIAGAGICTASVACLVGSFMVISGTGVKGATIGSGIGFLIGSNHAPDRDTKILLWPYTKESLEKLKCTRLEGQDGLEIKK